MDVERAIRSVRARRWYASRPIPDGDLAAILESARWTGSGKNRQPWQLVVVRGRGRLDALATCGPWAGHLARAPLAILVTVPRQFGLAGLPAGQGMADTERVAALMAVFDAGRLVQTLVLAAWSRGIASCPATMHDQGRARAAVGMPEEQWIAMSLALGYPVAETPAQRDYVSSIIATRGRRPLDDLVHYDAWGVKSTAPAATQGGER